MNICENELCCGCGLCESICPSDAVSVLNDENGFLVPVIDEIKCIKCNKCKKYCLAINDFQEYCSDWGRKAFYGCVTYEETLSTVSSGGIATALSDYIIDNGGCVYGTAYSENYKSTYILRVDNNSDIEKIKGSKYVQSNKNYVYRKICNDLNNGITVLFIALPCEIAALKAFLGHNMANLYTIDLICHGPTSSIALSKYIDERIEIDDRVQEFSMRYKKDGVWTPYYMFIETQNKGKLIEPFWGSDFGFIFGRIARESCYNCKYKDKYHFSDLTIGDAWGCDERIKHEHPGGLSSIIINSDKGQELIDSILAIKKYDTTMSAVIRGNPNLKEQREYFEKRDTILEELKTHTLRSVVVHNKSFKRRLIEKIVAIKRIISKQNNV